MTVAHPAPLVLDALVASVPDGDGTRVLFDGVDLEVAAGEVVAVTGPSGSGKSTMLSCAALLRRPDGGEVRIAGRPTAGLPERQRARVRRDHVAVVYQDANLFPSLTASEQLELVAHVGGRLGPEARREAAALLEEVGLGGRGGVLPAHLSGGERQRVGIARALMSRPSVLVADEPTAALDPELAGQVAGLLADRCRRHGVAAFVVTHDEAPLAHADRHLHLAQATLAPVAPAPAGAPVR